MILEGWHLAPTRVASLAHPPRRAGWRLMDDVVREARLRADMAGDQGGTDVERVMRHDLAGSRGAHDRGHRAAAPEARMVIQGGPEATVDARGTRCVQRVWPRGARRDRG